jgi:hypothetical protein
MADERTALEQRDGFVVLRLEGEPYQMGLQHGRLLRDRIQLMRRTLYQDLIFRQGRLFGYGFVALCRALLAIMQRHIPADLKREMRGVADGARVPYLDILFFNCFDDLLHALVRLVLTLPAPARARMGMACSSFVALGERTASGRMLMGRNLDYYLEGGVLGADGIVTRTMKQQLVVYAVRPVRGRSFVSIGWPGCIGVVTGLNDRGLALACLTSPVPGQTPNGTPLPLLYRAMLQRCERIAEVEAGLRRSRRTIGNNLIVASAVERDAALFEYNPWLVRRVDARDGQLATTNHYQGAEIGACQREWLIPNSLHRLQRLSTVCATPRGITVEDAQRTLLDTITPDGVEPDVFSMLFNPGTVYGAVIAPEDLRLWLRATDRPDRSFEELDAAALLELREPAVASPL